MKKTYLKDKNNIVKFGNRLRELRLAKGYSQEDFANECGLPLSQIGRTERGEINTSISHVFLIAKTLKVHPKELFNFDI